VVLRIFLLLKRVINLYVVDTVNNSDWTVRSVNSIGNEDNFDFGNAINDINPNDIERERFEGSFRNILYGSRGV